MAGFLSSIFSPAGGTAHNGPQPAPAPAAPVPAPAATPAAPAPAAETAPDPLAHLDIYKGFWQNPTTADGKPAPPAVDPLAQPLFNLDPSKVMESANKMDFMAGIDPAKIQTALQGDVAALGEVINGAVRNAVVGVTLNQGNTLNQALIANNQRVAGALPTHIKKVQLMEQTPENPVFEHEAVQPLVNTLKQFALARNPQATATEINAQISGLLGGLATALHETSPEVVKQRQVTASKEQDWSSFLS